MGVISKSPFLVKSGQNAETDEQGIERLQFYGRERTYNKLHIMRFRIRRQIYPLNLKLDFFG